MKKILVPTDFSKASERAAKYAFGLAKDLWADIHFIHVYQPPLLMGDPLTYGGAVGTALNTQAIENMRTVCTERMETFVHPFRVEAPTRTSYSVLEGSPVDEILRFSKEEDIDIILMSTHGESALYRSLFGSVTAATIRRAEIPVLTIPKDFEYTSVKKLAFASDNEITDGRTLWRLDKWLKLLKPELHAVHIIETEQDLDGTLRLELLSENLDQLIHRYDPQLKVECHVIADENLSEGLEDFIEDNKIDLLVVKTHERNLLGQLFNPSTTKRLLFNLDKPMLVLHEGS